MRVLFCGDREWSDADAIRRVFDRLDVTVCIEGECRGADKLAAREARLRGIEVLSYPADWAKYGRAAGPIRNQQMIYYAHPEYVVALHSDISRSKGTADMVRRAREAGIPVEVVV